MAQQRAGTGSRPARGDPRRAGRDCAGRGGPAAGAAVVLAAIVAARVAHGIGLPGLLLFLGLGLALGEAGVGVRFDDAGLAQALGLSALVLILAEGGLTTSWAPAMRQARSGDLGGLAVTAIDQRPDRGGQRPRSRHPEHPVTRHREGLWLTSRRRADRRTSRDSRDQRYSRCATSVPGDERTERRIRASGQPTDQAGVSARSANSGRHQPHPAFDRSGLRRARRASGGDNDQVRGWLNPLGSAQWDSISMCSPHHLRPARAGRRLRLTGKHTTGWGRMRPGRSGCRRGGGTSLSSRHTYRAGFDANYAPAYGRCRSPGAAAEGSRPMRDSERCNERNPS